jgi:phosphoribosyl-ATP pyrophosphohydrolase/phosphoribosyl-AMP cyclohydrolase
MPTECAYSHTERDCSWDTAPQEQELLLDQVKWDSNGLVPAIVQDHRSGDVLMLAYMNRESLKRSLESGQTWFWSRSRRCLWHKGETSGHFQSIREIRCDCDADALLVRVDQQGVACHTGAWSCFYRTVK